MVELSKFEEQRRQNIIRNKELLKKLDLDSLNQSFTREAPKKKDDRSKRRKTTKPAPKVPAQPSRKSSRLAGVSLDNDEEYNRHKEELEQAERRKRKIEQLKSSRLYGNFSLIDLVTDKRSGKMKFEDKVMNSNNLLKEEDDQKITDNMEQSDSEVDIDEDNKVLQKLQSLGDKFSAGDFYDIIREKSLDYNDRVLESKRKDFDNLKVYEKFDPLDIKIAHSRITSMNFHPAVTDRVISAGDTSGNLGIWAVDSSQEDVPAITILRAHGRNISELTTNPSSPSKILSSSYDGSVRELDLNKLSSKELAYINDPYESSDSPLGISDIKFNPEDPNVLYMTTLTGNFLQHDLRTPFMSLKVNELLRLHDKKIGGFSINPNFSQQVATASLDRSLRVWDLRKVSKENAFWSEFDDQNSPYFYGSYGSRLSISCVDWNAENRLVCNGYDDTINIFDLNSEDNKTILEFPQNKSKVNRRKVPPDEEEGIPENIKPFTKIRHNCQTGRWVSILKSKWQSSPRDNVQKFIIANMNRGLDVYDQNGTILAHLAGEKVGAVPAVCTFHPSENWAVGGSASGKVYLFN